MKGFSLLNRLRNISIARKLYFTVGIMGLLIAIELMTLMFAIKTLSSVRAYVGAEGLWSKAQKDAVYSLQKYGQSRNEKDYQAFLHLLKVPMGDRKVLMELNKPHPDLKVARQGFLEGRLHPDDIDGAIKLFRRFNNISYIHKAIGLWIKGDSMISVLQGIALDLHQEINSKYVSNENINSTLERIDPLNDQLTRLEDDFSYTLSEGSRWLANLILTLLFGIVLTVEISGLSLTIAVSRGISKGLNEIIRTADKIAAGDFSIRAKAFSRDEIGQLAHAFNEMTNKLEQNINALKLSEEELNKAKDLAEESVVIKEHFLANMSHEIRTPMNAVIGFTNLLKDTPLNASQQEFLNAIKVSSQSLMTIINDILDYSKIESGMIVLEQIPFSVRSTFESLQVLLQQRAQEKQINLKLHTDSNIPEILLGDPIRLTQILLNLTDNALKFTSKGSVELYALLKTETADSATLEFQVKDTGKGIPEEKLSAIFERFTQESAETTRQYGGTGLGLSIVKSLVELQKGTISLKSEVNKGSVFSFEISYLKQKETEIVFPVIKKQNPMDAIQRPVQILLAEDNKTNQFLAVMVLKKFGFETEIADNGKIAIEKMQEKEYDLILMDMQMPEIDGYEATRIIRQELKSTIPIIALTAHAMSEEREKCLRMGMNDYISKPFDQTELYNKIITLVTT